MGQSHLPAAEATLSAAVLNMALHDVVVAAAGVVCLDLALRPVPRPPKGNELVRAEHARIAVGGPAAAALLAVVKLGGKARLIGPIGNDAIGQTISAMLRDGGINTDHLWPDESTCSSASALLIGDDGSRAIVHCSGSNGRLTEAHFPYDALSGAHGLLWAGPGICDGLHGQPGAALLKTARARGLKTAVDTVSAGLSGPAEAFWMVEPVLAEADYFFVSLNESHQYTGHTDANAVAAFLIGRGAKVVFVKMGPNGMLVAITGEDAVQIPAYPVSAVDKTGSGDCTVAATFVRLLQGYPPVEAARFGTAVGAMVVRAGKGAHGVPTEHEVREFALAF